MSELQKQSPNQERPLRVPVFFKMLGHLAVHAYEHLPIINNHPKPLFAVMEERLIDYPQPLHPDIPTVVKSIREVLVNRPAVAPDSLSLSNKFTRSARMIQFTDRLVSHEHAFFDYSIMKELKDRFVATAQEQAYPLGFDQQLDIALNQADNNLDGALTTLWFASRQYARWLDSVSIFNLPTLMPEEIMGEMEGWHNSILACKNADEKNFQDASGDTYYFWTHVRARVMYGIDPGIYNRIGMLIFKHGTTLNSHRIIEQSIPSDHRPAAKYGNAAGDSILEIIKSK